jgi:hypothetical protein
MLRRLILMLMGFVLFVPVLQSHAQETLPCEFDSQYYPDHLHLRIIYHGTNRQLSLINRQTREVIHVLENDINIQQFEREIWSPNCRYVSARIHGDNGYETYIWNIQTGVREQKMHRVANINWHPTDDYAILQTFEGAFLWHTASNQLLQMTYGHNGFGGSFYDVLWDVERGRIFTLNSYFEFANQIGIFDLGSGSAIGYWDTGLRGYYNLFLSADHSQLVANSWSGIVIWDLNSDSRMVIDTPQIYRLERSLSGWRDFSVGLSLDNRYFVAVRDAIYVWDLQQPSADGMPNYIHDGLDSRMGHLQFLDGVNIEVQNLYAGPRYGFRWNIVTGDYITTFDYVDNIEVNRDGTPLQ